MSTERPTVTITDYVTESQLAASGCLGCIDGRVTQGRIGAPGGDLGEFLLIAAATESELDVELSDAWIHRALLAIVDGRGSFAMHTDVLALRELGAQLGRSWETVLEVKPSEAWRKAIIQPAAVGCGHIRNMLVHSRLYGVHRRLVERTLRAFYALRAMNARMELHVLQGEPREQAYVQVQAIQTDDGQRAFPLAMAVDGAAFIEHPEARVVVRDSFINLLASDHLIDGVDAVERVRRRGASLAIRHREATLALLAPSIDRSTFEPAVAAAE